jgi:tetratricopeptide (TPR) repeat protein
LSEETLSISPAARAALDRLGLEFQADVYGIEVRERPNNALALISLGMVLTQLGRYTEGLVVDRKLVELQPEDSNARYNLACSLALVGECAQALSELEEAVRLGYDDPEHLIKDEVLISLREEPKFQELLAALQRGT